ncbi:hypothetical protein DCAR_0625330 [Daucus carota subsp. sativus]|uniref:Uncharacterized protein n=1 Tax=Daucus carota subsp. sativus TaxID=79200 RepID=A0A161XFH7_DAUCS|nr:PREDICTED: probable serine/threonine-protein kinase kinX [Daucus carota subsp. sativus]WOH05907.1 hypothetical protein DCAR_0625330 [Daucus carota subsp. sativus]
MESSSSATHRSGTNTTTSELFICFSSRNNSMKTSSKSSILSPGRARDTPTSLSTSLSRRLRTSGSIKNGQASPMFPTGNKRRGSGFENPEPSSPKVTCIGQVRVKTKKQGKKMRNLSRRPSGEMSFRKMEHNQMQRQSSVNSIHHQQECSSHRNQRWVHLPLTICETLRGFGSEFSCLFPCKSSCFSGEKVERDGRESGSSCVDVFAKWLVAVEDERRESGGGKRRDIELVVENEDEDEDDDDDDDEDEGKVVKRRHVFDEIEIKDYDEERGRVSICIPPKNALLLMRCRSDPVKMEALANRFWEPQLPAEDEELEDDKGVVNSEKVEVENEEMEVFEERRASVSGNIFDKVEECEVEQPVEENEIKQEELIKLEVDELIGEDLSVCEQDKILEEDLHDNEEEDMQSDGEAQNGEQEKALEDLQSKEDEQDIEPQDTEENNKILVEEVEENESSFVTALEVFVNQESELVELGESRVSCCDSDDELNEEAKHIRYILLDYKSEDEVSKPEPTEKEQETALENHAIDGSTDETQQQDQTQSSPEAQLQVEDQQEEEAVESNVVEVLERGKDMEAKKEAEKVQQLPDCLLLMMCEPKLSMEVSKETWVCSTDFIRWRPQKKKPHAPPCYKNSTSHGNEEQVPEKITTVDSKCGNPFAALPPPYPVTHNQAALQPGRASCCLPAGGVVSMAAMIEQKLVDAVAYEPFVLTRCKSEPMRTASKLAQGACFWKNRAMEPHRRATYGAAGVGC